MKFDTQADDAWLVGASRLTRGYTATVSQLMGSLASEELVRIINHLVLQEISLNPQAVSWCGTRPDDDSHHKKACSRSDRTGIMRHAYLPE